MTTVERSGVQFDMCPTCRGVWLDRGELEKLMAVAAQDAMSAGPGPAQAYPQQPARPPQPQYPQGYGEQGERGEYGERGEHGERGHGYGGYRKKRSIFDIFD
jgi:Zn-finger nucleic acid-binding protein